MQKKILPNIAWTIEESAVFERLSQQRQCTSAELIQYCRIENPHRLIEIMNQKLAATEWHIFSSIMRSANPKKTPLAYYRLLRQPQTRANLA